MLRGIDAIQSGADERHGAAGALQRAFMGRPVDAHGQAGHDRQPGLAQEAGKGARVVHALGRGAATAHDGDAGGRQQLDAAQREQQQWRVARLQQQRRIARVAEGDDVARQACGRAVQPALGGRELGLVARVAPLQRSDDMPAGQRQQRRFVGRKHPLRGTERREQFACGGAADARRGAETKPGGEFVAGQHGRTVLRPRRVEYRCGKPERRPTRGTGPVALIAQGCVMRSPGSVGAVVSSTRP